jgi:hypothetical protein
MIFHTILKWKPKVPSNLSLVPTTHTPAVAQQETYTSRDVLYSLGKLQYANMLKSLPFKKGDFVMLRTATFPYTQDDVWKVEDIQECHFLCKDNAPGMVLKPIILSNKARDMTQTVSVGAIFKNPAKELEF